MFRIIYYDISDNKARNKISNFIEFMGFDRVQYSVFLGKTNANNWKNHWNELNLLHEKWCEPSDRIFSHVIDRDHFEKMSILGPRPDLEWLLQEIEVLFF